jgi:MraZ protein
MFRGINLVILDTKGRIALPARYRELLKKRKIKHLVLTIDTQWPCLLLYPLPQWEIIEARLNELPSFNSKMRRLQRLLIGHATELELDNNGRLLLPGLLRDYAKFNKRIMLIGQGKKFELWDESIWDRKRSEWLSYGGDEMNELDSLVL